MLDDSSRSSGVAFPSEADERDNTGLYALAQFDNQVWQAELSGRSDDNEQFGRHNTWQTGAGWRFVEDYRLSARYGTGFRALLQRSLLPEVRQPGSEAGRVEKPRVDAGRTDLQVEWRLTGYRNDFEQMIQWATGQPGHVDAAKRRQGAD